MLNLVRSVGRSQSECESASVGQTILKRERSAWNPCCEISYNCLTGTQEEKNRRHVSYIGSFKENQRCCLSGGARRHAWRVRRGRRLRLGEDAQGSAEVGAVVCILDNAPSALGDHVDRGLA